MPALTETVELTRHALSLGVTTVVMLPPFYYKDITDEGLYASYSEVVQRIADPRLEVVLYHIPQMSHQPIPHAVIARRHPRVREWSRTRMPRPRSRSRAEARQQQA